MINKAEVEHIATLARIKLSTAEVEKFQKELSDVLEYFEVLRGVDATHVEPMTHAVPLSNRKRKDEAKPKRKETTDRIVAMAPDKKERFVKVKAIL